MICIVSQVDTCNGRLMVKNLFYFVGLILVVASGCSDPATHDVTGKVTLGGKPYNRLIVYMRPVSGTPTKFTTGVGSTDAEGNLSFGSNVGGLAAGTYRVTFSLRVTPKGKRLKKDDKGDEDRSGPEYQVEAVPPPYDDVTSADKSPVEFVISNSGDNRFEFDIPK